MTIYYSILFSGDTLIQHSYSLGEPTVSTVEAEEPFADIVVFNTAAYEEYAAKLAEFGYEAASLEAIETSFIVPDPVVEPEEIVTIEADPIENVEITSSDNLVEPETTPVAESDPVEDLETSPFDPNYLREPNPLVEEGREEEE